MPVLVSEESKRMARVLLYNFENDWALSMTELFRREHHCVDICAPGKSVLDSLLRAKDAYDLLVLDVSMNHENALKLVKQIKRFRLQHGVQLKVLCVSRADRGPRFEFELEQEGARLVHVR